MEWRVRPVIASEAKQSRSDAAKQVSWIASSQVLLAMTAENEAKTASDQQPRAVIPGDCERPHRAGRFTANCDGNKVLGAPLFVTLDENLARRADLRCQPPLQESILRDCYGSVAVQSKRQRNA